MSPDGIVNRELILFLLYFILISDVTIETVSKSLMLVELILSFISLVYTLACIAFGGFVFYVSILLLHYIKVRKRAKIRNQ